MYCNKIFSLDLVNSDLRAFSSYLLTKKITKPEIVLPLTMNEVMKLAPVELSKIDYLVPDGMPLVWLLKFFNSKAGRIYGPDLMKDLLNLGRTKKIKHYFYGVTPKILNKLEQKVKTNYPGVKICGKNSPPFRELSSSEENKFFARISEAKPDFVWLGLGGVKQVKTALKLRSYLKTSTFIIPVGAAFDFLSENKPQAPVFMQRLGLEWLFRLLSEPRRLWRRYLLQIPVFLVLWFLEAFKILFLGKTRK